MHFVEGYGKAPEDQVFEKEVIPQSLTDLKNKILAEFKGNKKLAGYSAVKKELYTINRFWEILDDEREKYEKEIEWLKLMWYYRLMGKFLFINGKVVYITGGMHWYLNWCKFGNHTPDYRDRDRRWYIGKKWGEVCTTTFANVDPETRKPIPNEIGEYEMKELGRRVILGCNFVKARVVGDTSKCADDNVEFMTRTISDEGIGIQGKDDDNAESVFQQNVIHTFIRLPVFFKPIYDGASGVSPKNKISFENMDSTDDGLHMWADFATSSDAKKYDGRRLLRYHLDEPGKIKYEDVNKINGVVKFCLSTGAGNKIVGNAAYTTTVDEIEEQSAGANFMKLCSNSHYEIRDENGETGSGMINIFFRAEDGLAGYIGKYGESIIGKPTPEQALFIGHNYGARQHIDNKIAELRRKKDWEELALFRRQHPQCWLDCFTPPPKAQVFRRDLIEAQLQRLKLHPELKARRGNLGGTPEDGVFWIDDEQGLFYLSRNMSPNEVNLKFYRDGMWWPVTKNKFIGSPDTFGQSHVTGYGSKGGLVIRWLYDSSVDPEGKEHELWDSDRIILTFAHRPDTVTEYCELMLKAHVWIGAQCYPEYNKGNVQEHFERRGFGGYLMCDIDRKTGKPKKQAGWYNQERNVEEAQKWLADDIVFNSTRYYHPDILEEYLTYGGREYLHLCDLIASDIGTHIGKHSYYYVLQGQTSNFIDASDFVPDYNEKDLN